MWFVETSLFTRQLLKVLPDDQYRLLQESLALRPEQGVLIPGGAGLRKVRWSTPGTGKRGGCRVIYFWDVSTDGIYFVLVYGKSEKDNLTRRELNELASLVREAFK